MTLQNDATRLEQLMGWPEHSVGVRTAENLIIVRCGNAHSLVKRIEKNDRAAEIVEAVRELFGVKP